MTYSRSSHPRRVCSSVDMPVLPQSAAEYLNTSSLAIHNIAKLHFFELNYVLIAVYLSVGEAADSSLRSQPCLGEVPVFSEATIPAKLNGAEVGTAHLMPIERAHQRSILRQWRSFGFAVAVVKLAMLHYFSSAKTYQDLTCITLIHTVSSGLRRGPAIVFLTLDLSAKLNMDLKERFFGDSIERVEPFRSLDFDSFPAIKTLSPNLDSVPIASEPQFEWRVDGESNKFSKELSCFTDTLACVAYQRTHCVARHRKCNYWIETRNLQVSVFNGTSGEAITHYAFLVEENSQTEVSFATIAPYENAPSGLGCSNIEEFPVRERHSRAHLGILIRYLGSYMRCKHTAMLWT
ncbi:hypothetical protein EDD15DRAFT_2518470 [Pisolithus albus]|nr:hypothetical protein EDD15DRAFT_2518470 [Pisolithus albus]